MSIQNHHLSIIVNDNESWVFTNVRGENLKILQIFFESMKHYNKSKFNYKREKTLKFRSSLYLKLGSLRNGGK